jgi:hypothetical protein
MIYDLMSPAEVFDEADTANLVGIVLIGDDFAGHHEAYDTQAKWRFGKVGSRCRFEPYGGIYEDFLDFMEKWFVTDEAR